ncbi:MAG: SDR family oxidoreductase [Acidimicrobiales bacterium]|nr:SDR family oxidoreductase [Acidimicrobiales bacterium]MDG1876120.1 SDR family oxidoreductase [Acidimicrobiales bacterium]
MTDFSGITAVVTGGAQGIGRAIADRLAADSADVIVGDLRDPGDLGDRQRWVELDVTSEVSTVAFAAEVDDSLGVVVNNAGIMFEASITDQTVEQWDMAMAVNLRGPWLMTKALLPQLQAGGGGSVVNVGSIEGIGSNPQHTAYAASKGGVHGLTAAMAVDLGPMGIRCNAVAPGWIDTALNREYIDRLPNRDQAVAELAVLHPVGHIGDPADVASTVAFLASTDARFVSGQVVVVDGARTTMLSLPPSLAPKT